MHAEKTNKKKTRRPSAGVLERWSDGRESGQAERPRTQRAEAPRWQSTKNKNKNMTVRRIGCGGAPASFENRGGHRSRAAEPSSRSQEWLAVAERPNALRTGAAARTTERLSRAAERRNSRPPNWVRRSAHEHRAAELLSRVTERTPRRPGARMAESIAAASVEDG